MSHLIIFVLVKTEPVNEIGSLISNVACGEFLPVSHQFKAQRAKGVGIFEVGGVRLQGQSFCNGVCEFGIDHVVLGIEGLGFKVLFSFHEGRGGDLVEGADFAGRL